MLTRCSTLTFNIIPMKLRYTVPFKQRLLPHCWPYGLGSGNVDGGRGQANMPPRSLLPRPQRVGKKISPVNLYALLLPSSRTFRCYVLFSWLLPLCISLCCKLIIKHFRSVPEPLCTYMAVGDWCLMLPSNGCLCDISLVLRL
jgi:hypothetical protein